jgi:hypothetical protein
VRRVHQPHRDGEDPFLPAAPYDADAAAAPALPPLDPRDVLAAATALERRARDPSGSGADGGLPPAGRWRGRGAAARGAGPGAGPMGSVSRWSDLELLDRTALEDKLIRELAEKAAPKFLGRQGARWAPAEDGWAFDLGVRPPTPALDLLTDYLEVKYR